MHVIFLGFHYIIKQLHIKYLLLEYDYNTITNKLQIINSARNIIRNISMKIEKEYKLLDEVYPCQNKE